MKLLNKILDFFRVKYDPTPERFWLICKNEDGIHEYSSSWSEGGLAMLSAYCHIKPDDIVFDTKNYTFKSGRIYC